MLDDETRREILDEIAPTGILRAAINMSNFLLVTGQAENGNPEGVSPDLALHIGNALGVPVQFVCYPNPGALADAVTRDEWDIGNIGAEPQRAKHIAFTDAYCEIEATFLVPAGSPLTSIAEVDRAGHRIAVMGRAAYGLWLENNIREAELVRADTMQEALDVFTGQGLDALAGLRPRLTTDCAALPGSRMLDGRFMAVQQAVGTPRRNTTSATWLAGLVEDFKRDGMIGGLIEKHGVDGLTVAAPRSTDGR